MADDYAKDYVTIQERVAPVGAPLEPLEERRKPPKEIYYHGTASKNLRRILSQGLIPNPKQRAWAEDPQAGLNRASRASYGGIYLTRDLTKARMSLPREDAQANRGVIVVAEVQPRSLTADEDDVVFWLDLQTTNSYQVFDAYVNLVTDQGNKYTVGQRTAYAQKVVDQFNRASKEARGESLNAQETDRLRAILDDGYLATLTRKSAYIAPKEWEEYNWRRFNDPALFVPQPSKEQGEQYFRLVVDQVTRTLPGLFIGQGFSPSARTLEPLTFSGANRIIAIAEIVPSPTRERRRAVRVVYGKLPADFEKQWEQGVGPLELAESIQEFGSAGPGKPAYPSDNRPSAAKRGYGHGWRKDRDAYLRDHPYCEVDDCDASSHSVHHQHAVKDGGPNHPDNYYATCAAHHNKIEKSKSTCESINEAAWNKRGSDLGVVYHGSNEFIKVIDPSRLQSRDAGFYGRGFYVSQSRTGARFYGGRISTFSVDPNATVLQGALLPAKAPPGLVDEVIQYKYDKAIDRARARGKEDLLADELEYIRTSPISWSQALNDYVNGMGYDIAVFAPGEMVVKNLSVLTRVPTARESINEGAQDQKFRQQARDAFKAMMRQLRGTDHKGRAGLIASSVKRGYVMPGYADLRVTLDFGQSRSAFGHIRGTGEPIIVFGLPALDRIDLAVLRGAAPEAEKNVVWNHVFARMEYEEEAFIHEFIHYLDDQRAETRVVGASGQAADRGDVASYVNNPIEYNAFYQSIVSHFFNNIDTAAEHSPERVNKVFHLLYPSFQDFYKTAVMRFESEEVGGDFWKYLTPENKKRAKKRLAQTWEDLQDYAREKGAVTESLDEGVRDQEFRQKARDAFDDLMRELRKASVKELELLLPFTTFGPERVEDGFTLPGYPDVYLVLRPETSVSSYGTLTKRENKKLVQLGLPKMTFFFDIAMMGKGDEHEKRNVWDDIIKQVEDKREAFIHEFIHHFDDLRTPPEQFGKLSARGGKTQDAALYYNSPTEYNAYYQSVVSKFFDTVDRLASGGTVDLTVAFRSVYPDFKSFYQQAIARFEYGERRDGNLAYFWKYLSDDNKKRLKKRLVQTWEDLRQYAHDKGAEI